MQNLKNDLQMLYNLQEIDVQIEKIKSQINQTPVIIELKNEELNKKKCEIEDKKKVFVSLSSLKKEKELLLSKKEEAVKKHTVELNTTKDNTVYKKLELEISKDKSDMIVIEDEILDLMEKLDKESVLVKSLDKEMIDFEKKIKMEIVGIEKNLVNQKTQVETLIKERDEKKKNINKTVLDQYERIKEGRNGQGLSVIDEESCGGCGMVLTVQTLNQASKYSELVFCDNCSRILYKK